MRSCFELLEERRCEELSLAKCHCWFALAPKPATECTWWHLIEVQVKVHQVESMKGNEILCRRSNSMKDFQSSRHLFNFSGSAESSGRSDAHWSRTVPSCLPGGQRRLHALRQGAGGGGFIELVLWSGQRSQHAHWNGTNTTMKHPPGNIKNCRVIHRWASSYFSPEWRSSWRSQWSGDPSSAARFQPSQTGPSNLPAEPTDAPPPETGRRRWGW